MTESFYADISEFQTPVTDAYPYPILAARAHSGGRLDYHIAANWAWARASSKCRAFIAYVVFIPGALDVVMRDLRSLFGQSCPAKLALMIDMESGGGFAGPGDHSAEANRWAAAFAAYTGSRARVVGYANRYDFDSNWPTRPPWLKLITASYGSTSPGTFGWQYWGGVPNPTPPGYPTSCPPFGSNVDLNVIHDSLPGVLVSLGLATPTPTPKSQEDEVIALTISTHPTTHKQRGWLTGPKGCVEVTTDEVNAIHAMTGVAVQQCSEAYINLGKNALQHVLG